MTRMRTLLGKLPLLAIVLLSLLVLCQPSEATDCFGSLRKPLTEGGFTGSLDCSEVRPAIEKIGSITMGGKTYLMFDDRYMTVPQFSGAQVHGGQSILVFQKADTLTYLGRYNLSPPPFAKLRVTKTSIKAEPATGNGTEFVFTDIGPPSKALFDGYLVELTL